MQEVMITGNHEPLPLWYFLLPAGFFALLHLAFVKRFHALGVYLRDQWHVWGRLMVIFSLLWFLGNGLTEKTHFFAAFFDWPEWSRYSIMVVLALGSSITDNVALAAMQGQLILQQPIDVWKVRVLLILFTWSGGFTPFGCLQSLALNHSLGLSTGGWFKQTFKWAFLSLAGGSVGLLLIWALYPGAVSQLK